MYPKYGEDFFGQIIDKIADF